jgi:hypothetical protein
MCRLCCCCTGPCLRCSVQKHTSQVQSPHIPIMRTLHACCLHAVNSSYNGCCCLPGVARLQAIGNLSSLYEPFVSIFSTMRAARVSTNAVPLKNRACIPAEQHMLWSSTMMCHTCTTLLSLLGASHNIMC